jgi:undecaprenyl-diphosphatase
MSLIEAIVLGAVQGITEFLPISSTGHLILVPWLLGWEPQGLAFDVALHVGTLLALLVYFRNDWIAFAKAGIGMALPGKAPPNAKDRQLVLYIVAATIPGGVAGLLFEDLVETMLRGPLVVAATLILVAGAMAWAERNGRRIKDVTRITWADALVVGVAQALAIVPGVSRSGITITAGLARGMERATAARFSFLLSAPIIGGAASKKVLDLVSEGLSADAALMLGAGIVSAAIVGYLAIAFMLRYLATHTTYLFVGYRVILGIVVLLAFWFGFR